MFFRRSCAYREIKTEQEDKIKAGMSFLQRSERSNQTNSSATTFRCTFERGAHVQLQELKPTRNVDNTKTFSFLPPVDSSCVYKGYEPQRQFTYGALSSKLSVHPKRPHEPQDFKTRAQVSIPRVTECKAIDERTMLKPTRSLSPTLTSKSVRVRVKETGSTSVTKPRSSSTLIAGNRLTTNELWSRDAHSTRSTPERPHSFTGAGQMSLYGTNHIQIDDMDDPVVYCKNFVTSLIRNERETLTPKQSQIERRRGAVCEEETMEREGLLFILSEYSSCKHLLSYELC